LVFEEDLKEVFLSSVLRHQKLIEHTADNDFPSDEDQVKRDVVTLKSELAAAIESFIKGDPVDFIENLREDMVQIDEISTRAKTV